MRKETMLNVKGLKKLLRNTRGELGIKFYDVETCQNLIRMTIDELMQDCKYDSYVVEDIEAQFWMSDKMDSAEDMLKGYVLNVGIDTEETCDNEEITVEAMSNLFSEFPSCSFGLMHKRFVGHLNNIQRYDIEDQMRVLQKLEEYKGLTVDSLKIDFNERVMFELWTEYEYDFDEADEYYEIMSVEIMPVLPKGMILFY